MYTVYSSERRCVGSRRKERGGERKEGEKRDCKCESDREESYELWFESRPIFFHFHSNLHCSGRRDEEEEEEEPPRLEDPPPSLPSTAAATPSQQKGQVQNDEVFQSSDSESSPDVEEAPGSGDEKVRTCNFVCTIAVVSTTAFI